VKDKILGKTKPTGRGKKKGQSENGAHRRASLLKKRPLGYIRNNDPQRRWGSGRGDSGHEKETRPTEWSIPPPASRNRQKKRNVRKEGRKHQGFKKRQRASNCKKTKGVASGEFVGGVDLKSGKDERAKR